MEVKVLNMNLMTIQMVELLYLKKKLKTNLKTGKNLTQNINLSKMFIWLVEELLHPDIP